MKNIPNYSAPDSRMMELDLSLICVSEGLTLPTFGYNEVEGGFIEE